MVVDAVRSYFDAASGLTELTRKRAVAAAKTLLKAADDRSTEPRARTGAQPGEDGDAARHASRVGHDIQSLASELIDTSQANRAALGVLVESEVNRVLDRLDLVPRDEYERVVRRVAELERRLAQRGPTPRVVQSGAPAEATADTAPDASAVSTDGAAEPITGPRAAVPSPVADGTDDTGGKTTKPADPVEAGASSDVTSDDGEPPAPSALFAPPTPTDDTEAHADDGADRSEQDGGPDPKGEDVHATRPDTAASRSGAATKGTKTSTKQSGSKTAAKSGKSKSTTKRSSGRARTTTPANKSEE